MGNFSRNTFDRLKHYVSVRLQQGVPIVDADWNELQDIRRHELETFLKWFVGDGVPLGGDGFAVADDGADNDFTLADGRCLVDGREAVNDHAEQNGGVPLRYTSQPLFGDVGLAAQWGVDPLPALTTPGAPRTDTVYLDVWEREVGAAEDAGLVHPALGVETSVRMRREWVARVAEGAAVPAAAPGHAHYPLATLARAAGGGAVGTVADLRRTGLTLASLTERTDSLELGKVDRAGDTVDGDLVVTGRLAADFTPATGSVAALTADSVSGDAVDKFGVQATAGGGAGEKHGVYGLASGDDGGTKYGVYGLSAGNAGAKYGVYGSASGDGGDATGIYGVASGTGTKYGARAEVVADDTSSKHGVYALVDGAGGLKYGMKASVSGDSGDKYGVQTTVSGTGGTKYAAHMSSFGDDAYSKYGVYANASGTGGTKVGLYGYTSGTGGTKYALYGYAYGNDTDSKFGVYAYAYGSSGTKYGIYAYAGGSGTSYAGYFSGNVHVTGTLSKGGGTFLIDHVLDPENKVLRHSFVESPEALCLYRGKVTLDASGTAGVDMPEYFAALTREDEATVLLTPVGEKPFLTSYAWEAKHTRLVIRGEPGAEVSYLVLADRDDPVIKLLRRPVEEDKASAGYEPGKYLYPEAYGQPAEAEPAPEAPPENADGEEQRRLAAEAVEEHRRARREAAAAEQRLAGRAQEKSSGKPPR